MWVVDSWASRYEPNTLHVEEMSLGQSIWIGLCQSLSAIFPAHRDRWPPSQPVSWWALTGLRHLSSAFCSRYRP